MRYVRGADAWADYLYWRTQDRRVVKRINDLIKDIARGAAGGTPHEGIGKPEALKHGMPSPRRPVRQGRHRGPREPSNRARTVADERAPFRPRPHRRPDPRSARCHS